MQEEPNLSPSTTAAAGLDGGDEPADPIELLRHLDRLLGRRATAIESELAEISEVRALIARRLPSASSPVSKGPAASHSVGQAWGK